MFPILRDLAHVAGWHPYNVRDVQWQHMFPGLDQYYTDRAHVTKASEELDYLDHDVSRLSRS